MAAQDLTQQTPLRSDCPHDGNSRARSSRVAEMAANRHPQSQPCCVELPAVADRSQQPMVTNTFDPNGQHMQREAAHKLRAIQSLQAFAP